MATTAKPEADEQPPSPKTDMDVDMDVDADAETDEDADADPITASYNIFLNPALPCGRRLLVLQHPNRTDDEPTQPRPQPTELRLKSDSGMVEVDVPLNTDAGAAYDREKGLRWGRALKSSMAAKNGGSHGLAGGFGFGAVQQRGGGRGKKGGGDADDEDKVLRTQTLGGQYPNADEVQYMVGVFQGNDIHLTPVSSLVLLRPQLHHIDATTQQERTAASAASSSAKEAAGSGSATAARAIHMTIKTTADGDAVTTETMADRLRFVQSEPWRKLPYTDENVEAAWDVYNDSLFLKTAPATESANDDATPAADARPERQLNDAVPRFGTKWGDRRLLEAVSGITKPEPEPAPVEVKPEPNKEKLPDPPADEAKRPRAHPKGAASAATRRGGRAKPASSKADASTVNID
ncbi:Sin-like protein [Hirsutella rhossiliensis]|uniref:Sin-like protein n=1 Tax=Hirsutella rhossiliensis TaxID=111463 RepID=A0A9P8SKL8_9HYPO|nr:Sin-like protein [Hirsutella rhossiliensis]KAH0966528.1 Sin-like protein [Hirsutella rhossiliensis]